MAMLLSSIKGIAKTDNDLTLHIIVYGGLFKNVKIEL